MTKYEKFKIALLGVSELQDVAARKSAINYLLMSCVFEVSRSIVVQKENDNSVINAQAWNEFEERKSVHQIGETLLQTNFFDEKQEFNSALDTDIKTITLFVLK